ncbi:CAP domain-containing protein [Streptomyces sp. NPDC053493]|uniref:CAP domain-containing protein n=1 Tax=Streptomyces sp. NPDC053493 TaxID=3365705 RepID=UPI0037D64A07
MQHDAYDQPLPQEPAAHGAGRGVGRHRRAPRRGPSFRTAVAVAGAVAAALTVTAGVHLATTGAPTDADTRPDAGGTDGAAARVAPPPMAPLPGATPVTRTAPGGEAATPATVPAVPPRSARAPAPAPAPAPTPVEVRRIGAVTGTASVRPASERALPAVRPASREQAAGSAAQYEAKVVSLVNTERRKAGCEPLRADPQLRQAAQSHADDMAAHGRYSHDGPDGSNAGDRIAAAGYSWSTWGENIHRGPRTPARAVEEWMNSDGHRENILNCAFKDIGVGVNLASNGPWWVQDFASAR